MDAFTSKSVKNEEWKFEDPHTSDRQDASIVPCDM